MLSKILGHKANKAAPANNENIKEHFCPHPPPPWVFVSNLVFGQICTLGMRDNTEYSLSTLSPKSGTKIATLSTKSIVI